MTISGGFAVYPLHAVDRDALISIADKALYRSKSEGQNRMPLASDTAGLAHLAEEATQAVLLSAPTRAA